MKILKKIFSIIMVVFFPLSIMYCIMHALTKDFCCFLGCLFMVAIGFFVAVYVYEPQLLQQVADWFIGVFDGIKGLF